MHVYTSLYRLYIKVISWGRGTYVIQIPLPPSFFLNIFYVDQSVTFTSIFIFFNHNRSINKPQHLKQTYVDCDLSATIKHIKTLTTGIGETMDTRKNIGQNFKTALCYINVTYSISWPILCLPYSDRRLSCSIICLPFNILPKWYF